MEENLKLMLWDVFSSVYVALLVLKYALNEYPIHKCLEIKILFAIENYEIPSQDQKL